MHGRTVYYQPWNASSVAQRSDARATKTPHELPVDSTLAPHRRWSALMRVLYLGSTDLPQPKARAIQIVHTCHALASAGAEVTLVAGRRGRSGQAAALRAYGLVPHPRLRLLRVPIARIPPTAPPRVLAWFTRVWQASYLAGLLAVLPRELALHRPNVVFARDLRTARLAAGPAHAVGARLLVEVHGLPSVEVAQRAGRATLPPSEVGRL